MQFISLPLLLSTILIQVSVSTVSSFFLSASLLSRRHILLTMTSAATTSSNNNNPSSNNYWNRETSQPESYTSSKPITNSARIVCLSDPNDKNNEMLYNGSSLPEGSKVLAVGTSLDDLDLEMLKREKANVIFLSYAKVCENQQG